MVKSKLVYTTDKNDPAYVDNVGGMSAMDGVFAMEANIERRQSISQMNKSKRRHITMPKSKEKKSKPFSEVRRKEFTWIINRLSLQKISRATLGDLLPNRNKKYIDNIMQTIKFATAPYIFSKDGFWQIEEGCPMDSQGLIDLAIENRNARFTQPKKDKAPLVRLPRTKAPKAEDDLHEEFYGDHLKRKKIVVDGGAPVEIEIKTGNASIVIKIG